MPSGSVNISGSFSEYPVMALIIDFDSSANFIPLNDADNWLHLILGIGMVALGLLLVKRLKHVTKRGPLDK